MKYIAAALAALLVAHGATAQPHLSPYPSRALRIIVPFPPGGTADAVPRIGGEDAAGLIRLAREAGGKMTYASQGNGTTSHLTAAMFQQMAGVQLVHIAYKGTAPALTDLMGGRVDIFFDNISSSLAPHRSGKI